MKKLTIISCLLIIGLSTFLNSCSNDNESELMTKSKQQTELAQTPFEKAFVALFDKTEEDMLVFDFETNEFVYLDLQSYMIGSQISHIVDNQTHTSNSKNSNGEWIYKGTVTGSTSALSMARELSKKTPKGSTVEIRLEPAGNNNDKVYYRIV